jgi:excisionase family DNA binding protein
LIKQAADLLGVSRRTVYYRIGDGQLRTIRTRCGSQRVLLSSIEALIKQERSARQAIPSQAEPLTFQVEAFSRDA